MIRWASLALVMVGCSEVELTGTECRGDAPPLGPPRTLDRFVQFFPLERAWFLAEVPDLGTIETWAVQGDLTFDGVFGEEIPPGETLAETCDALDLVNCILVTYDPVANAVTWETPPALGAEVFVLYVSQDDARGAP